MMNHKINVKLKSDALIGSGEGFGAIIDTDVVFDEVGIPYIPGRRIKGCLKDSANEVCGMFEKSGIDIFGKLVKNKAGNGFVLIDEVFGTPEKPSCLNIYNLTIEEYENNKNSLRRLIKDYPAILPKDEVISYFTSIRQQTKIDNDGVAEKHSLRTVRAVKRGNIFEGSITVDNSATANDSLKLLWLACINLRHLGTKRNRGFGEVECLLCDENNREINFEKELKEACR